MVNTPFSKKCDILAMLWVFYKDTDNEGWQEFFKWADIGLPMAYMSSQGHITIKKDGKNFLEDTWNAFCEMISIDPKADYETLADCFEVSPNDPIEVDNE